MANKLVKIMKKIFLFIFGIIIFSSCIEQTSYKLEDIEYIEEYHTHWFLPSQPHYKYSIIISKDNIQKHLIISTYRKLNNIQSGDSIYLRNNDLIKIVK